LAHQQRSGIRDTKWCRAHRADFYVNQRDLARATDDINAALTIDPSYGFAYLVRARAKLATVRKASPGALGEAKADLQKAVSLDATLRWEVEQELDRVGVLEADLRRDAEREDEAKREAEREGEAKREAEKAEKAERDAEAMREAAAAKVQSLVEAGRRAFDDGRYDAAIQDLREAVRLDPQHHLAESYLRAAEEKKRAMK
jgi:tetratricopeptide (TPR) repeat protein